METGIVTPVAVASKGSKAADREVRNLRMYELGVDLCYAVVENEESFREALKLVRSQADRDALRAGFVATYMSVRGVGRKTADQAFDRRAAKITPETSRKAASNKAKSKAGRKETTDGKVEQLNASAIAQRLAAVLHYVAKAQAEHVGDEEILNLLGEIAAICGGVKKTGKRK